MAIDSVANLTNRLRGSEAVALEVEAADGQPNPAEVQQRLEQVPGVSRVVMKDSKDGRLQFRSREPARPAHPRRPGAHRGQFRLEPERMRAVGLSLEDIFLQLTAAEQKDAQTEAAATEEGVASNEERTPHLQKEFKSYFASPIAYLLMAFFGLIFGFGFYTATRDMVRFSFMAQMQGAAAAHERQRADHPARCSASPAPSRCF